MICFKKQKISLLKKTFPELKSVRIVEPDVKCTTADGVIDVTDTRDLSDTWRSQFVSNDKKLVTIPEASKSLVGAVRKSLRDRQHDRTVWMRLFAPSKSFIYQIYVGNVIVGTFSDEAKMKRALGHLKNYVSGTPLAERTGWSRYQVDNSSKSAVTNLRTFEHDRRHLEALNRSFK